MKINDIYEVEIKETDNNGNGICRIDNIVTFIFGALKDEKVKIRIKEINKHFIVGELLEILIPSKDRVEVPCKYYNLCGGCNLLHTTYENEMSIKKEYIERLFNTKVNILNNKNILNYRNKITLHVINGKLGYFNDSTHFLCEIDQCLLIDSKINLKIDEIKKYNLNGLNEIMIRCINNEIMINIKGNKVDKELYNIETNSLYINDKHIKGKEYLIDVINNIKYTIYPESFYQVNKEGMNNIYNKALEYSNIGNNLIDLYCGTGTIGIWLNKNYKNILGIEINASSIKNANINKELNNIKNITFKLGDASLVKEYINNIDTIVVDPPRSGLSKNVINILDESKSNKIVYVSCNPKTLKRDIDLFNNYELKDLSICNMFPRTKHVETVCLMSRKEK